jgi:hypothetical protein
MDTATITIGIIGAAVGAIVGAFSRAAADSMIPKNLLDRLARRPAPRNRIGGEWDSWWGSDKEQVKANHEVITIVEQRGERLWGTARRDEEPGKEWELEGRFDGQHLQMIYYPSEKSSNTNFLDYGCYFFVRHASGTMDGLSIGRGPNKDGSDTTEHEFCYMKPRK